MLTTSLELLVVLDAVVTEPDRLSKKKGEEKRKEKKNKGHDTAKKAYRCS